VPVLHPPSPNAFLQLTWRVDFGRGSLSGETLMIRNSHRRLHWIEEVSRHARHHRSAQRTAIVDVDLLLRGSWIVSYLDTMLHRLKPKTVPSVFRALRGLPAH
jgi:hypothetical protein